MIMTMRMMTEISFGTKENGRKKSESELIMKAQKELLNAKRSPTVRDIFGKLSS